MLYKTTIIYYNTIFFSILTILAKSATYILFYQYTIHFISKSLYFIFHSIGFPHQICIEFSQQAGTLSFGNATPFCHAEYHSYWRNTSENVVANLAAEPHIWCNFIMQQNKWQFAIFCANIAANCARYDIGEKTGLFGALRLQHQPSPSISLRGCHIVTLLTMFASRAISNHLRSHFIQSGTAGDCNICWPLKSPARNCTALMFRRQNSANNCIRNIFSSEQPDKLHATGFNKLPEILLTGAWYLN